MSGRRPARSGTEGFIEAKGVQSSGVPAAGALQSLFDCARSLMVRHLPALFAAVAFAFAPAAVAQQLEPARPGTVDLAAEASREVQNDTMTAVMYAEAADPNPVQLAATLTRAVNDALAIAGTAAATKVSSGGNQTVPIYERASATSIGNRITGWRGRAEIRLEGRDFREIGMLVGRLQSTLRLGGVSFAVSPELRRRTENELIGEAIAAFRERADIARQAIGARAYRVGRLQIGATAPPRPRPFGMEMRAEASLAAAPPTPQFEGGSTVIQVTVNGYVETE